MKQILHLVPSQNLFFFAFKMASIIALFPPRIWGVRATFKAVLTAVDMKKALQAKCKTCFGGPTVLDWFVKNMFFQKSSLVFSLPSLTNPPPVWQETLPLSILCYLGTMVTLHHILSAWHHQHLILWNCLRPTVV